MQFGVAFDKLKQGTKYAKYLIGYQHGITFKLNSQIINNNRYISIFVYLFQLQQKIRK